MNKAQLSIVKELIIDRIEAINKTIENDKYDEVEALALHGSVYALGLVLNAVGREMAWRR